MDDRTEPGASGDAQRCRQGRNDEDYGGIVKINPLAEWSHDEVWQYIGENNVPFNGLHKQGYPSIGCAPCTRAVKPGDDLRAGRWWWEILKPRNADFTSSERP